MYKRPFKSFKCQLHTTHLGPFGWELYGSSPMKCAGKEDHGFCECVPPALSLSFETSELTVLMHKEFEISTLYIANFSRYRSSTVILSEVTHKSDCIKFSGLISKLKILEKSY